MDVASPVFRPRAAERPRRNGDLIPARSHNRFEVDRIAADPDPARLPVVDRRDGRLWVESKLFSHSGSIELAIRLIPDGRQPIQIREVRAVRDDGRIRSVVIEAMRLEMHVEGQSQRLAGPERLVQAVYPVAELLVLEHASGPAIER